MKLLFTCNLLLFLSITPQAQNVTWAFNTSLNQHYNKLAVDRFSNLYVYGYSEYYSSHEGEGSILAKYSPDGTLLFKREWNERFFIHSLLNDGKGHFYFCGHFKGEINAPGIKLRSQGDADAFIGKMDEEGNVEWTIGFGGAKVDLANDLTFNSDSTSMVIAGGVDSTFVLYDYEMFTTARAIFVAKFDLKGQISTYKTFAFTPKEYGNNMGLEIESSGEDGYFLLADRMGDHWSNEAHPSGSPMEGRHIFSLDAHLNTQWSQFIISSACYYGYSCNGLGVQQGQACIPSFCSGKYGGSGHLQKLAAGNGITTWSITNNDGTYYDTYCSGKNLLYVGNEEANGCPCPENNPGFGRVKILDQLNGDQILLSKYGFFFYNVIQAPNRNIYVYGGTWSEDPHLQGKPLSQGYFLFAMSEPPTGIVPIPDAKMLTVFPNPSSGYVEIVHDQMIEELTVFNASGAAVRFAKPEAKAYTIRDLGPGYYFVRVKDAKAYATGKLLVEK